MFNSEEQQQDVTVLIARLIRGEHIDSTTDDEIELEDELSLFCPDDRNENNNTGEHEEYVPCASRSIRSSRLWEGQLRLLVEYKKKHKTTIVPQKHSALGSWVAHY